MAVNIDTVYQKVLMFANKEQRGYITPQEFNLFADQAQNEIFDQYFYDLNQFSRNNTSAEEFADMTSYIQEKISVFKRTGTNVNPGNLHPGLYKLGTIWTSANRVAEEVTYERLLLMKKSKLLTPRAIQPVYTRRNQHITIHPDDEVTNFTYEYIKQPDKPSWTYVVVNGKAMYDPNNSSLRDFELHHSEENELVYKILKYAGVSMKKADIVQTAQGMEISNVQQQKQ